MDDSHNKKLTKKQRKSLAFRERKAGNKKAAVEEPENQIPEVDLLPDEAEDPAIEPSQVPPTKKRKRDDSDSSQPPSPKKLKDDSGTPQPKAKPRFILFLGNLSYRTTKEAVLEHFKSCEPLPEVRLLTPKPKNGSQTTKSKGCAFLEFETGSSLQTGLKLHGTQLEGRKINVELTSGGGGKSDHRLQSIRQKNKKLQVGRSAKVADAPELSGTQRHSTTSGAEAAQPLGERTWSIPVAGEKKTRGGRKHSKGKTEGGSAADAKNGRSRVSRKPAWQPSGANAISVG